MVKENHYLQLGKIISRAQVASCTKGKESACLGSKILHDKKAIFESDICEQIAC